MVNKVFLSGIARPVGAMARSARHKDASESSKSRLTCSRLILGYTVNFYESGLRVVEGLPLDDQECFDSQILRFAHASVLIGEPVGDKCFCYVDSRANPVEVWLLNRRILCFDDLRAVLPGIDKIRKDG